MGGGKGEEERRGVKWVEEREDEKERKGRRGV